MTQAQIDAAAKAIRKYMGVAIDKPPHGVARLWRELKQHYRHVEFISEETRKQDEGYGIGVIFRDER